MIGGRATIRGNRKSEISNQKSEIVRFLRDEGGQGIIFAAATLLLLVGFVALVYNIGRVVERRTKMQLGADSAAYAGATVEGNSLSAIGWINSAMAQIYYNALKYAVDVNVAGVAAELERQLNNGVVDTSGPAYSPMLTRLRRTARRPRCRRRSSGWWTSPASRTPSPSSPRGSWRRRCTPSPERSARSASPSTRASACSHTEQPDLLQNTAPAERLGHHEHRRR